jgi:hypothetical protein
MFCWCNKIFYWNPFKYKFFLGRQIFCYTNKTFLMWTIYLSSQQNFMFYVCYANLICNLVWLFLYPFKFKISGFCSSYNYNTIVMFDYVQNFIHKVQWFNVVTQKETCVYMYKRSSTTLPMVEFVPIFDTDIQFW